MDVIVATEVERLWRNDTDRIVLQGCLVQVGATYDVVRGGRANLDSADERLMADVIGALGKHENAKKSERQGQANQDRRSRGEPVMGGPRPFGWDDERVTPRPAEAAVIRRAVMALRNLPPDTKGYRELQRIFKESGLPTTRGSLDWSAKSCEMVLLNPKHAGLVSHARKERTSTGKPVLRRDILWDVQATWPEIISRDEYRELRERLEPRSLHGASAVI